MSFNDRDLTCRDCGAQFTFTAGEQEFFSSRGLTNDPVRCPECRRARKDARGDRGGYVYSSSSDGFTGSGNGGGGGGGAGYGADRPRREMFTATCTQCGKDARVPFQPRGDKPVYCSDCFESVRSNRGY